ncbi:latrophilin Cirl-like isoform X3 [Chrysoperla carnea]|uniref:latrophilin Cirl-like isoform X3 n=1 Tax=Chrysoperla carnea TaxID=189513 RepID=UPI001D08F20A|nr:latrophilin Cirl-like isoform X3 [Chrysoperla carnea]
MDRFGSVWRLFLISTVIWIPSSHSRSPDLPRYETAYACEGKTLKIECGDGERIHLIRANYGRFSITICNDHGNTDWSVNCMSHKSLRVLHNRCEGLQLCAFNATNESFDEDPCPFTTKYVEAHFYCTPLIASTTTTTSRPSPPWLITSQPPSVWSTLKPTVRPPMHVTTEVQQVAVGDHTSDQPNFSVHTNTSSSSSVASPGGVGAGVGSHTNNSGSLIPPAQQPWSPSTDDYDDGMDVAPVDAKDAVNNPSTTSSSTSVSYPRTTAMLTEMSVNEVSQTPSGPSFHENNSCSPVTERNLHWNWTRIGDRVVQSCPGGATGLARWRCIESASHEPIWSPETPDLSECRSVWLTSLESRINEEDSLIAINNDLASVTSSKTLYGGDMMITTKIIFKMAQKMAGNIKSFPDTRQRETIVTELLSGVVRTGSNLLDSLQYPSWKDLGHKEQMQVATSLLIGLEENAFLLADTVVREKIVIQSVKNIMLSVRVLETHNIGNERFPRPNSPNELWSVSDDWVQIPKSALRENSEGGLVRLVFVAFDRLEEILEWNAESYDQTSRQNISRVLNSKVISASLGKGRHIQLSEPIRLSLRHIKTENVSNPSCVFWDYTMSAWSEEGCRVESTNATHTICQCDHLTNFAILMDIHMTHLSAGHQMALQIITYVGCIISIICLILAIITFHSFKGLKSDRTTIHKNLCFCLLIAEVLFVVGIGQTEHAVFCSIVAGLLQLFFLCAFAWMFLEGFQLYVMLVEVFEAEKSRAHWYYLFAYGLPLLIVSTAAGIDPLSYGTPSYCWLRAESLFIFTFVTPVVLVILTNIIFLSMAIFIMCRHANASISMKSKEHSRLASARVWLRGAVILVFLLGLTWTFGLLYLNEETVVMAYIFSILNSLQGLFIFMFHCIQNEKVRKEYRKLIRRHSWFPKMAGGSSGGGGTSSIDSSGRGVITSGGRGVIDSTHVQNTNSGGSLCKDGGSSRSGGCGTLYTTSNGSPATHSPGGPATGAGGDRQQSGGGAIGLDGSNNSTAVNQSHQYSLQRGWSSRSCNTIGGGTGVGGNVMQNNIENESNLNNYRYSATSIKRLTNKDIITNNASNDKSLIQQDYGTNQMIMLPSHAQSTGLVQHPQDHGQHQHHGQHHGHGGHLAHLNDDQCINNLTTSTLPYIKNHANKHINCSPPTDDDNPNLLTSSSIFPKSATTWGPLNKSLQWKNISSKSYSRDSGHGGSEQENSPRSYGTTATSLGNMQMQIQQRSHKELNYRKPFLSSNNQMMDASDHQFQYSPTSTSSCSKQSDLDFYHHQQQQQLADLTHQIQQLPRYTSGNNTLSSSAGSYQQRNKKSHGNPIFRTVSPWNHTYTEIHDNPQRLVGQNMFDDPVYEEIDRNEIQVSDMSDEDGRRQSDMSRQSSRSYGDHRPLIPYSPAVERNVQSCMEHRLGNANARSLAAVLDGETVVCHLEPPELYHHQQDSSYSARTVVLPPYTEC